MTPYETAKASYTDPEETSLAEDLVAHLQCGYVVSTPEIFILLRPVDSKADYDTRTNMWHRFDESVCDTWYIWMMAGSVAAVAKSLPFQLPFIEFARRGKDRRPFKSERILHLCGLTTTLPDNTQSL